MSVDTSELAGSSELGALLEQEGYLADDDLATVVYLALRMGRPLFLEGEAGVGKTEVAKVLARLTGGELVRLQCYDGIEVSQAVYEWDYARQLLHLRAAEQGAAAAPVARRDLEHDLFSERFLIRRPLLRAVEGAAGSGPRPVLLIDEIDRADDEFEAYLLELLADFSVTIPELGTIHAERPPVVVITSNRTRDVHDALKRRCLYHWVDHPALEREIRIVEMRVPGVGALLAGQVAGAARRLRSLGLYKPPGVAETIDWALAITVLGETELTEQVMRRTIGSVLKYREDAERVREVGYSEVIGGGQANGAREGAGITSGPAP
ncbi:MAG: AAA family ATPase [Acidimicrobiales bacterium]